MSHFTLESTVDELTKMDAPLERGPLLRWQRKAIEARMRAVSIDGYYFPHIICWYLAYSLENLQPYCKWVSPLWYCSSEHCVSPVTGRLYHS